MDFKIAFYGTQYLDYLKVAVQSILQSNPDSLIHISYSDIRREALKPIRDIENTRLYRSRYSVGETDMRKRVPLKLNKWYELLGMGNAKHNILLDVDTLVVQNMAPIFDRDFDIMLTYKTDEDEGLKWPINTGVVAYKGNVSVFVREWQRRTINIIDNPSLLESAVLSWGAADQAALGTMVRCKHGQTTFDNRTVEGFDVAGIPCSVMNETRCVPASNKEAMILHYKGSWHKVFQNDSFRHDRPQSKCYYMYSLWKSMLRRFDER
jgi:hypothetical protein